MLRKRIEFKLAEEWERNIYAPIRMRRGHPTLFKSYGINSRGGEMSARFSNEKFALLWAEESGAKSGGGPLFKRRIIRR